MHKKEVYKFKGKEMKVELKECHPRKLSLTSRYVAPYWYQALRNIFEYSKRRDLQEVHKLVDDRRIRIGLELYHNGYIEEITVTTAFQGDVNAIVLSRDKKKRYRIIMKNFLPERLPQYTHEREEYLANLLINCSCDDHGIARYRDNASMMCKHICAIIWFLINKFNMPKIFIMPGEMISGWKKSETKEIETEIQALPLIKFTQHINILLLGGFRGMNPALGLSIHRIDNVEHKELGKPQWLTYTQKEDVVRLITGMTEVLNQMGDEKYKLEKVCLELRTTPIDLTKNRIYHLKRNWWTEKEIKILKMAYRLYGTKIPELRLTHSPQAIRLKAHRLEIKYYRKIKNMNKCIT